MKFKRVEDATKEEFKEIVEAIPKIAQAQLDLAKIRKRVESSREPHVVSEATPTHEPPVGTTNYRPLPPGQNVIVLEESKLSPAEHQRLANALDRHYKAPQILPTPTRIEFSPPDEVTVRYSFWRGLKTDGNDDVHLGRKPPPVPRLCKLSMPGFAGSKMDAKETTPGQEVPQPYHCKPFIDAASGMIELYWVFQGKVQIFSPDGKKIVQSRGHHKEARTTDTVAQFAPGHYGIGTNLRLHMPHGWGGLVLPHPNCYMRQKNLPTIIPGLLEFDWWPHCFFVVSSVPRAGEYHELIYGEPFACIMPVRSRTKVTVEPMTKEEDDFAVATERLIRDNYKNVSTRNWQGSWPGSGKAHTFGNAYKVLSEQINRDGFVNWEALAKRFGVTMPPQPRSMRV
jgi:hypothetical protein